jgi:hypothetical protein
MLKKIISELHCSFSSTSSTVTVRLVKFWSPELLAATAELEASASVLSATLPKLQLDSSELGSAGFGDELVLGSETDGPDPVGALDEDGPVSSSECDGWTGAETMRLS